MHAPSKRHVESTLGTCEGQGHAVEPDFASQSLARTNVLPSDCVGGHIGLPLKILESNFWTVGVGRNGRGHRSSLRRLAGEGLGTPSLLGSAALYAVCLVSLFLLVWREGARKSSTKQITTQNGAAPPPPGFDRMGQEPGTRGELHATNRAHS